VGGGGAASGAWGGGGRVGSAADGRVRWVDMLAGVVLSTDPDTGATERTAVGEVAACLRPRRGGGFVLARERGFAVWDPGAEAPRPLGELWSDPSVRMNEGACDPQGRFYCGSMAYDAAPGRGALWRLDPDGSTSRVLDGVTISNGLAWTSDARRAYYIDTPTRRIDLFDADPATGALTGRRPFVHLGDGPGAPDGLCLDAEGGVWVALWDGSAVHRYDPGGALSERVELPVLRPTACTFGGPGLDQLFVTTSRENLDAVQGAPPAGALLRLRPGVKGVAPWEFAG
jgi:sugar lactone lactonase YvrE